MADEEIEYESDPEEGKLSLKLRRREASDDEEEDGGRRAKPPRRVDDSDGESEGAAAEYEDEVREGEGERERDYDSDEEEYLDEEESGGGGVEVVAVERLDGGEASGAVSNELTEKEVSNDAEEIEIEDSLVVDGEHEGDRKEIEPYAVPTAGAFYMHDDRFRDNVRGRNRRTLGGRRLWESKDEKKWGHDKFEELTMQERYHEEARRGSKGHYRGRGRNRGSGRGYAQGNRPREYNDYNITQPNNNPKIVPKSVRGRGPRRYQPSYKNSNEAPVAQKYQSGKYVEKHSNVRSEKTTQAVSNSETEVVQPRKQVASNLNIASPPFYPTGSSSKDNIGPLKRDVQTGTINQNGQQSILDEGSNMARPMRGKSRVDSIGFNKLYIDGSASAMTGKPQTTVQMSVTGSANMNPTQPQLRGQGRGTNVTAHISYQPDPSSNQVNKAPSSGQPQNFQRNTGQSRSQSTAQGSIQQFTQHLPGGHRTSSPPSAAGSVNAFESGEMQSASDSNQAKSAGVSKGKGVVQSSGKGSFMYSGAQVIGATGSMAGSDQNFPAFLPVMQFGGQHPGGIGVPAVGMAFPGYVGQPQLGHGSPEMTWLPVLAGAAAGALGAAYCPPYITVDGSYNPRPSGQAPSTTTSSKETTTAKGNNDWKPKSPEIASDDFGQRQKNPRRYTEMKFDQ
ncbi:protein MLN51 homolog [Andrographis paniculata]|uniref:protein MLN51 homolog n=1 Tax=Andrographis paniculata TaxID=175694 RepID=UPI0021E71042|nr:protein MLN51 homolog [Andrographis paniculata]